MPRYCLLVGSLFLLPVALAADPVYLYTASTVNYMMNFPGASGDFSISGAGFSALLGAYSDSLPTVFRVGDAVPLSFSIGATGAENVDFGGFVQSSNTITGGLSLQSSAGFVIPPNPVATYTFPTEVKGMFRVEPAFCGGVPIPSPPCGAYAQIGADFLGQLTVQLIPESTANTYTLRESFAGTPVPEPASVGLSLLEGGLMSCLAIRPKRLRKRYTPSQRDMPGISRPN